MSEGDQKKEALLEIEMQHFPFFLLKLLMNNGICREPKTFFLPGCSAILQKLLSVCKNAFCGRERNYSFQLKHPELTAPQEALLE